MRATLLGLALWLWVIPFAVSNETPPQPVSNPAIAKPNQAVIQAPKQVGVRYVDVRANALRHIRVGEDWMARKQFRRAVAAFQVALALNPDSTVAASVYHNLGLCYRQLANYPLAIVSHQRAMRLAPGFAIYALHLALDYQAAGLSPTAKVKFEQLLAENPTNPELSRLVGYLD